MGLEFRLQIIDYMGSVHDQYSTIDRIHACVRTYVRTCNAMRVSLVLQSCEVYLRVSTTVPSSLRLVFPSEAMTLSKYQKSEDSKWIKDFVRKLCVILND